jgi:ABC-type nitrate/sulfonate/bicarbonate transport system ATPase subunit
MSEPVALRQVGKRFALTQAAPVLERIDLVIEAGEFVAIVGPSGCGKSTLLRMIGGLETPTSGSVAIGQQRVAGVDPRCALMFQEPRLLPWKTVRQNVELGARGNRALQPDQWLKRVGLHGVEATLPQRLSGGMAQRVALARALIGHPQVLLLDEPFGALDALTKMQMQDLLAETTQAAGATVIMVTHDIDEAVYLADRVVILGQRPAQIVAVYRVEALRPRDRSDGALTALRSKILEHFDLVHHVAATRDYQI